MKKLMFLMILFGLMISITQCASPSRDSATAPKTKATAAATETKTETKKESLKENSDSKNTKIDLKALAKEYVPNGAEIIHNIVQGKFAPAGVRDNADNVVIMYREKNSSPTDPYETIILQPTEKTWKNYMLPFYRTRIYDWTGSEFRHLDDLSDKISADADTADKVRKELKRIIK